MGVTYKALDVNLRFAVTLKVINAQLIGDESINMIFQHEFTLVVAGAFTCLQELQRKPNGRVSGPTYFFRDCRKKRRNAEGHRQPNCALSEVKHRGDVRVAHARRRPGFPNKAPAGQEREGNLVRFILREFIEHALLRLSSVMN